MKVWLGRLRYATLNAVQRSGMIPAGFRRRIVRRLGHRLSDQTYLSEGIFLSGDGLRTMGSISINARCFIDANAPIEIGEGVRIACEVMLVTTTHAVGPASERAGDIRYDGIRIGEGSWIGARATILPGVSVASGCIIAAGAVVAGNTEANGVYAGVPARRIKELSTEDLNLEVLPFAYSRAAR
ncbi:acyltransferase [Sphingomonas beigongshangi]|uniref:acyltransferase n=1 Tax=Sphingomonas beigongshangi TaxID=2782540 RepID=UPI001EEF29E1|nr:acyltransferase [Sphingomonas beigongshangi]